MISEYLKVPGKLVIILLSLIAALGTIGLNSVPASAFELIIGTGPHGSLSHHSGKLLCRIFTKQDSGLTCSISETSDPVDHLTNVQGGSLDLAIVDSLVLEESKTGKGAFQYLDINYDQIRIVAPLYEVPLTLIARSDAGISTIDQLPGKKINAGRSGSPEKQLFELFMLAQGWTTDQFPVFAGLSSSLAQDTIALHQGDVQVLVHKGVHPDNDVKQLVEDPQTTLIGFSNDGLAGLIVSNPALSLQDIKKFTYPSLSENLSTFGTTMTLICSADMADETIWSLISALEQNKQSLQSMHPALSSFDIDKRPQWFGSIKVHKALLEE